MKAKLNFRTKRTIIIIAVIAILAIIAGTTTYYFVSKSNDTAEAANYDENSGISETVETPDDSENNSSDSSTADSSESETDVANSDEDETSEDTTETTDEDTTENDTTTTTTETDDDDTTTTTTDTTTDDDTDTDATVVYEEVTENIVVESPWETHQVSWVPETLSVSTASVEVSQRDLTATKTAVTSTGYGLVSAGEKITYTITVTNNEENTINSLYISDAIPENTTFDSIDELGATVTNSDGEVEKVVWNLWNLGLEQGESITVSFTVTVNEDAQGKITNFALVEGEETNTVENAVLESSKTSVITRDGEEVEEAKVGDKITYTISVTNTADSDVENTSETALTTIIKDSNLENLMEIASLDGEIKLYLNGTEQETISYEDLINGVEVEIPAGATVEIVFTITVNSINGKIENAATIGDTPTDTDVIETIDWSINKTSTLIENTEEHDGKAEAGDEIYYVVTVTNNGSKDIEGLEISDEMLEEAGLIEGTFTVDVLAGETKTVIEATYTVTQADVDAQKTIINTVTSTYDGDEKETEDPGVDVVEKDVKLTVDKTVSTDNENFSESVKVGNGETAYFKIVITNNSNVSLTITAEDILIDNTDIEETLKLYTDKEYKEEFSSVELAPGEEITLYTSKVVDQTIVNTIDYMTNTVTVTGTTTEEDPDDRTTTEDEDDATVEVKKPNFVVEKKSYVEDEDGNLVETTEEYVLEVGETLIYQIVVKNTGETTGDATVTDEVPSELTIDSVTVVEGETYTQTSKSGNTVTGTITSLPVDETVIIQIETTVNDIENDADAQSGVEIVNSVYLNDNEDPENTTTDTASRPVIEAEKTSECEDATEVEVEDGETTTIYQVEAGDTITYTITVKNTGLVESEVLTIIDKMPEGLTVENVSGEVQDLDGNVKSTFDATNVTTTGVEIIIGAQEQVVITITATVDEIDETEAELVNGTYIVDLARNTVTVKEGDETIAEPEDPTDYEVIKPTTTYTVIKVWDDDGEEDRPKSITVQLYGDETEVGEEVILTSDDKDDVLSTAFGIEVWSYKWTDLSIDYEKYTVKEVKIGDEAVTDNKANGYVISYVESDNGLRTTITNSLERIDIDVEKVWVGDSESDRPESITVELYKNGETTEQTLTLSSENDWSGSFTELAKYTGNTENVYTIEEIEVEGYTSEVTGSIDEGFTVTNTLKEADIDVTKSSDKTNKTVAYGDKITYTITATNSGNASGSITITDTVPKNTELYSEIVLTVYDENDNKQSTITITKEALASGVEVELEAGYYATITFTVKVTGYAGCEISNTATYGDNETETETITSDVEATEYVVSTTTEPVPQSVILVLDFSKSMDDTIDGTAKIDSLKAAVKSFLETFLGDEDIENEVMIIAYSSDASVICSFTSDYKTAYGSISSETTSIGTNIDAGLSEAYDNITSASNDTVSVILMTDGVPNYYRDDDSGEAIPSGGAKNEYDETSGDQAKETAEKIKNMGATIYTIGFGLDSLSDSSQDSASQLLSDIAGENGVYYSTYNEDQLKNAFEDIEQSINDSDPIEVTTSNGIMTITNTDETTYFEEGQTVEIYTDYGGSDESLVKSYSWEEFIALSEVTYDEGNGTITFDVGTYMEDNDISADETITLRFVDAS